MSCQLGVKGSQTINFFGLIYRTYLLIKKTLRPFGLQCCIKTLYGYDLCTNLPRAVLTPTRYPAGQKSYSTEAGLLTCSDLCAFPISQWHIAQTCISQRERNLQQQVLFRILTGFPFHFGCSNSLKNHLHCKGSNYFVMLFSEGQFFIFLLSK